MLLVFRSAPVAAVAPLITLFMGRGIGASVVVVTIVSFFPLMVNLQRGLAASDRSALELLHVYGAGLWKQLLVVRIPYAMPYFFTGLRIAGASALLGTMLSEWITGARGLGKLILDSGVMRETGMLWAAVLTSVLVALTIFAATSWGEAYTTRWKQAGSTLKE
jgi:ABC-type nitrate/sulfonate/bicarbonate transport system permease component